MKVISLKRALIIIGLAGLVAVPLAYSRFTYEPAYLKTFLFQSAAVPLFLAFLLAASRPGEIAFPMFQKWYSPGWAMMAWLGWNLASCLWAENPWVSLGRSGELALLFFLALGACAALRDSMNRRFWLWGMSVTLSLAALYAIWLYSQAYEQFLPALFSNRELAANFFYLPAALAISAGLSSWVENAAVWKRIGLTALAILFLAAIERTQTSAAFGALIVLFTSLVGTTRHRIHLLWTLPVLIVGLFGIAWFTEFLSYTLQDLRGPLGGSTVGVRIGFWQTAVAMYHDHPLGGVGAGEFAARAALYRPAESFGHPLATPVLLHAHSFPLETKAELGLVGFMIFAWLVLGVLARCLAVGRSAQGFEKALARGLFAGLMAMFAHSFVGVGFSYTEVQGMFWLAAGLAMALVMAQPQAVTETGPQWHRKFPVLAFHAGLAFLIWWTAGLGPWRAQHWLSRGIAWQKVAADVRQSVPERRKAVAYALEDFYRVKSLKIAGNAGIPALLHLAATLDLRATTLSNSPDEMRRDWEEALSIQKRLLEKNPGYGVVLRTMAQIAYKLGDDGQALRAAQEQLRLNPFDAPSYEAWMLAAQRSGREESLQAALSLLRRARDLRPEDLDLLYLEGKILGVCMLVEEARARVGELEQRCRASLENAGRSPEDRSLFKPRLYLASLLMRKRPEEARQLCLFVLSIEPGHPEATELLRKLDQPQK